MPSRDVDKKSVLIVENDRDVREVLKELVQDMGYEVLTADRASQAAQMMEGGPVDAMLLDIHMPGPPGHLLLRFLKGRNRPVPPTIVVSGYINRELIPELIQLGVSGIVAKPFSPQRLREEIDRALSGSPAAEYCLHCGRPIQSGDRFCRQCGKESAAGRTCPQCKTETVSADRYCGKCGHRFA